jgi:3-deoxy-D-manno-octulosonic-acid transferase
LHAVSVGEVLACVEFLRRLRAEFPRTRLFISTATLTGYAMAAEKLSGTADGIFFAPVDHVFAVRRVIRCLQPSVVVIAETEIWPNLFREVKRTGASLVMVNGRISDRAFPRYLPWRRFFAAVLPAADAILVQTADIRERFLAIGAPPGRTHVTGNFKYDFEARPAGADSPVVRLLQGLPPAKVWIAASTMPPADAGDLDEDDVVIEAFQRLVEQRRDLLLILVPRRPERFDGAAKKLDLAGIRYIRRTAMPGDPPPLPMVLLLDTMGELSGLFAYADVVFMGGSLARRGGHNPLEPAFFGKAVIAGPHMENFRAIADEFRDARASVEIAGPGELAGAVGKLLDDPALARQTGERALACAQARRGATARAVEEVRRWYASGIPRYRPAMPWFAARSALAQVWTWGARRRLRRGMERRRKLDVPVVSIGNLTMGGTGKTPCVLLLAEAFRAGGRKPGILTRGYGRSSHESSLLVAPGAKTRAEQTGDEPQIFVRSSLAPVGIGADRFQVGTLLRRQFDIDLILLDDGFQHVRLARDLDLVLIDAIHPFGGGGVFPLGRLREPLEGLARADVILITRTDLADTAAAVETVVRRWNPCAPVFHARVAARQWVDHRSGEVRPAGAPPFARALAFCGLGNPACFRRTLDNLGVTVVDWLPFEDHHRYRPHELRRIVHQAEACGAEALVTTEKDTANLGDDWDHLLAPLPLYWLQVSMGIDREREFLNEIERRLDRAAPRAI